MSAKPPHEITAMLNAYLDGELSASQAQKLEQELARDPQMSRQLEQLRQAADRVGQIPRMAAPKEMTEGILQQLEREFLLGRDLVQAETAGRNHLRRRRLLAAAAMAALIGAVGIIIYGVLRHPDINPSGSSKRPTEVVMEIAPPADESHRPEGLTPETPAGEVTAEHGWSETAPCSSVQLVVKSGDMAAGKNHLEDILAEQQIKNVFRDSRDTQKQLYAFVCSLRQFSKVFGDIQGKVAEDIDLVVTDPQDHHEVVVDRATQEEACTLAGEQNTRRQLAYAMRFNLTAGRSSIGNENEESMLELFARGELELPDLKLLGPTGLSTDQPNQPTPIQQPFLANQPAPAITEVPAGAEGADSGKAGEAATAAEPDQLVAVVLVLQPLSPSMTDSQSNAEPTTTTGPDEPNSN